MPYVLHVRVQDVEIDALDHVNNLVYLKWVQQAALAHGDALGLGIGAWLARRQAFVVRRHEIDYLRAVHRDDALEVETRITQVGVARSTRQSEIRQAGSEQAVARVITDWAFVDLDARRAMRIPEEIKGRLPVEPAFGWARGGTQGGRR